MMTLESLIAIIWAAAAMDIYSLNLAPQNIVGTVNVVNIIADKFVPLNLACLVTIAVIVLPITSGDTALRGLRITIADAVNLPQKKIINRLIIVIPMILVVLAILVWAKTHSGSFSLIWRYFTFFNQLIAIPCLLCAAIYLKSENKNFFVTLIPALFYVFITMSFILNAEIGFNMPLNICEITALLAVVLTVLSFKRKS